MALTLYWRFENSLTLDGTHDYTAGDGTATANDGATFNNTQSRDGYAGYYDGPNDYHQLDAASIAVAAAGAVGVWVRAETWLTGTIIWRIGATATGNNQLRLSMSGTDGSGNLTFRLSQQGQTPLDLTTTNSNFGVGAWYFVVCKWDGADDSASITVYDTSGSAITNGSASSGSGYGTNQMPATIDTVKLGETGAANGNFWLDNAFVGSAAADGDTFYTKRDITSYTAYAGGSIAPPAAYARRLRAA